MTVLVAPHSSADISDCGRYRYRLERVWGPGHSVCWVMLNPSTADGTRDDATIRKITAYSKRWGFDSLVVVNLFSWWATQPKDLPADLDVAIGPEADDAIVMALSDSSMVVCGWGVSLPVKCRRKRESQVMAIIDRFKMIPQALAVTKDGAPCHPLYLKADLNPVPYTLGAS